jgi:hypothetical protein
LQNFSTTRGGKHDPYNVRAVIRHSALNCGRDGNRLAIDHRGNTLRGMQGISGSGKIVYAGVHYAFPKISFKATSIPESIQPRRENNQNIRLLSRICHECGICRWNQG